MLKKSASGVLASLRGSTYRSVRLTSSLAAALLDGPFEHPARYVIALVMGLLIGLVGCQTRGGRTLQGLPCSEIEQQINLSDRIDTLNRLADAFAGRCYDTVIVHGEKARSEFRHKNFSLMKETGNVFVPEGSFIDYVLESYERGYLSLLLAASYANVQKPEDAKVELRQLDHELFTPLYNYGEDPVNLLLSAVLWERVGEVNEARVDWLRLRDLSVMWKGQQDAVRLFAAAGGSD